MTILAGCSAASATPVDPGNDFHCLGVTLGFQGVASAQSAPVDQQIATTAMADWYWGKNNAYLRDRGKDAFTAEMAALARVIDADPPATLSAMKACSERAIADPSFNKFAARYSR
jgi:hypothetical protein